MENTNHFSTNYMSVFNQRYDKYNYCIVIQIKKLKLHDIMCYILTLGGASVILVFIYINFWWQVVEKCFLYNDYFQQKRYLRYQERLARTAVLDWHIMILIKTQVRCQVTYIKVWCMMTSQTIPRSSVSDIYDEDISHVQRIHGTLTADRTLAIELFITLSQPLCLACSLRGSASGHRSRTTWPYYQNNDGITLAANWA